MTRDSLKDMRLKELRDLATELGVSGRWRMKKAVLIGSILAARGGRRSEDEEVDMTSPRGYEGSPATESSMPGTDDSKDVVAAPVAEDSAEPTVEADVVEDAEVEDAEVDADVEADADADVEADADADVEADADADVEADADAEADDDADVEVADGAEVEAEPVHEPSEHEVYIDRGPALPERYPGRRIRIMVRDPGTVYAYWEVDEAADAWEVRAESEGRVLHSFRTPGHVQRGYLSLPAGTRGVVVVAPVRSDLVHEPLARVAFTTPLGAPSPETVEQWVELTPAVFFSRQQDLVATAEARSLIHSMPGVAPRAAGPAPTTKPVPAGPDADLTVAAPGFVYEPKN